MVESLDSRGATLDRSRVVVDSRVSRNRVEAVSPDRSRVVVILVATLDRSAKTIQLTNDNLQSRTSCPALFFER